MPLPNVDGEGCEPRISQNDFNFEKNVTGAANRVIGVMGLATSEVPDVSTRVELTINLELVCGPDGGCILGKNYTTRDLGPTHQSFNPPTLKALQALCLLALAN